MRIPSWVRWTLLVQFFFQAWLLAIITLQILIVITSMLFTDYKYSMSGFDVLVNKCLQLVGVCNTTSVVIQLINKQNPYDEDV